MNWLREIWRRFQMLARRQRFNRDLEDEMRLHRELRARELQNAGASPKDSRYAAQRRFGNTLQLRERSREMWGWKWLEDLFQDARFGLRMFAKRPGYAAALILVLALGIGGTSTIFTVVDGVLLEPLPYKDSSRIVAIYGAAETPHEDLLKWWGKGKAFSNIASCLSGGVNFSDAGRSERVFTSIVSASYFPLLGVDPQLGRGFTAEDETPQGDHIVVLSHRFWLQEYDGARDVLGKTFALNGESYTVVGVMPAGFSYPGHTDLWVPRIVNASDDQRWGKALSLGSDKQPDLPIGMQRQILARLRDNVTIAAANSEMQTLMQLYNPTFYPGRTNMGRGLIGVRLLQDRLVLESKIGLWVLLVAVGFFLLIACVNVTQMLLARAAARQKEIAVRLCMGAGRGRILRQMLVESTLVALIGGAAGTLIAFLGLRAIQAFGPKDIPRLAEVRLDLRALGFALAISLAVGLAVGIVPALQAMAQDLTRALKTESSRSTGALRKRLRGAMVVAEVALTLMLLMSAGLMIKSLDNMLRISPGFETQNIISMEFALPPAIYATARAASAGKPALAQVSTQTPGDARAALFNKQVMNAIRSLPGAIAVGEVSNLPLGGKGGGGLFVKLGDSGKFALGQDVSGDYFHALGIPVVEGRAFTKEEMSSPAGVIVVSQTMARTFWPGKNVLGLPVELEQSGPEKPPRTIVGVVGDVKFAGMGEDTLPAYYLPALRPANITLVVRAASDPRALVKSIRDSVARINPDVPLFNVRTMSEVVADSTSAPRFRGVVVGIFAALALILAVFGLYSVVAYSVSCRTHEMGVRMALGAQPRDILLMVTREGMWLALAGITLGALGSLWINKLIAVLLYGVKPTDPGTLIAAASILAAGTITACVLPARRASRTDPSSALRYE